MTVFVTRFNRLTRIARTRVVVFSLIACGLPIAASAQSASPPAAPASQGPLTIECCAMCWLTPEGVMPSMRAARRIEPALATTANTVNALYRSIVHRAEAGHHSW